MFFYFLVSILLKNNAASEARLIFPDGETPPACQSKRTLFNIVWSCLSTIIICAWTSVHPNVPPPNKWRARWERLKIMFWVIIAPELVIAWAVRQLFAAKEIRDAYNHSREGELSLLLVVGATGQRLNRNSGLAQMDVATRPLTWHGWLHFHRSRPQESRPTSSEPQSGYLRPIQGINSKSRIWSTRHFGGWNTG